MTPLRPFVTSTSVPWPALSSPTNSGHNFYWQVFSYLRSVDLCLIKDNVSVDGAQSWARFLTLTLICLHRIFLAPPSQSLLPSPNTFSAWLPENNTLESRLNSPLSVTDVKVPSGASRPVSINTATHPTPSPPDFLHIPTSPTLLYPRLALIPIPQSIQRNTEGVNNNNNNNSMAAGGV